MRMIAVGLLVFMTVPASAGITFEGAGELISGHSLRLSASAEFDIVGDNLEVTLANTSKADVVEQLDVLTGVFFDITGDPALTPLSAALNDNSKVVNVRWWQDPTDPDGGVGGEWAYRADLPRAAPAGQGISSSGLGGIFGGEDLFPGNNLQGPVWPDGVQYGITSEGDDPDTGNRAVTGGKWCKPISLIQNSVVFTLGGLPLGFALDDITNVCFNYGTSLNTIPGCGKPPGGIVPEPASLAVWGMLAGVGLVVGCGRRKKRKTNK